MPTNKDNNVVAETRPLLGHESSDEEQTPQTVVSLPATDQRRVIIIIAMVLVIMGGTQISASLVSVALAQAQEGILCGQLYDNVVDAPNDPRCKNADVQSAYTVLSSVEFIIAMIPTLVTAPFYGAYADKWGRRPVMRMLISSFVVYYFLQIVICQFPEIFPVRLIWCTSLVMFCGGGSNVFFTLVFAVVSDLLSDEKRLTGFFLINASSIIGAMISGPIAYPLMGISQWYAAYVGLFAMVLTLVVTLCLPETLHFRKLPSADEPSEECSATATTYKSTVKLWHSTSRIMKSLIFEDKRLGLLMISLMFTTIGTYSQYMLLQYISKRYEVSWAKANLLISVKQFGTLSVCLVIMPFVNKAIVRAGVPIVAKDLYIARTSLCFVIISAVGFVFSPSLFVLSFFLLCYSLNTPYDASLKSVMTTLAGEGKVGALFSTIALLESIGQFIAAPLMAWLMRVGLRWDGIWISLPYMAWGSFTVVAAVVVFGVRIRAQDIEHDENGETI